MVLPGKIGEVERAFSGPPRPVVLMKKPCTQGAVPLLPLTKLSQTKCPHCDLKSLSLLRYLRSTGVKGAIDTMLLNGERKKLILVGKSFYTKNSQFITSVID